MMLVVFAATGATLYLAENNLRANHQKVLDIEFQNQVHAFLALQEAQSSAITERCRALSRSVRLRAALEERDVDDLYRNALTELQEVSNGTEATDAGEHSVRASFFRFIDSNGAVIPPGEHAAGLIDQPALQEGLATMGGSLHDI